MIDSVMVSKGKTGNVESSIFYVNEPASKAKFAQKKSKMTNNNEHQREISTMKSKK